MKKKKIDFESDFWYIGKKHTCLTLIDAFYEMDFLADVKQRLFDLMNYSIKPEILMKNEPAAVFHFYLCMKSFIRAAYTLQFKTKKWKINAPPQYNSRLQQGSLSDEEYKDPFLVFQRAFAEFTLQRLEYFNTQIVYFSLGSYNDDPQDDATTPFIHLIKMLDAAQIIRERGLKKKKINKTAC